MVQEAKAEYAVRKASRCKNNAGSGFKNPRVEHVKVMSPKPRTATLQRKKAQRVAKRGKVKSPSKFLKKNAQRTLSMSSITEGKEAVSMMQRPVVERSSRPVSTRSSEKAQRTLSMKSITEGKKSVSMMQRSVVKRPSRPVSTKSPEEGDMEAPLSVLHMIEQAIDFVEHAVRDGRLHEDDAFAILVELVAASQLVSVGQLFGESYHHKLRAFRIISRAKRVGRVMGRRWGGPW